MKRSISSVILVLFVISAAAFAAQDKEAQKEFRQQQKAKVQQHVQEQRSENKAFRDSLKGMTPAQRKEALKQQRAAQKRENLAFRQDLYNQNKAQLQARLAKNNKLTQEQKEEILKAYDSNHNARTEYREGQYKENMEFVDKISNDTTLTQEQKKAAIKEHFKAQKEENKKFREAQKAAAKEQKKEIKGETGEEKAPGTTEQ